MITETFLDSTIATSEIFSSNYTVYRLDRNCHGGGVLIAVLEAVDSFVCPQYARPDIELLWIQLLVTSKPIMFGVFYRPPSSPDSYLMELQHSFSLLPSSSLIFLGEDFNVPGVSPSVEGLDKSSSSLSSIMDDFFLDQCVSTPTRGSNLIDLVFTNSPDMISSIEVIDSIPNTDHDCIEFSVHTLLPKQVWPKCVLYNYKKTDFDFVPQVTCGNTLGSCCG